MRLSQYWQERRTTAEVAAALQELRQRLYEEVRQDLPDNDLEDPRSKGQAIVIPTNELVTMRMDEAWGCLILRASVEAQFDLQAACALHSCILYGKARHMQLDEASSRSLLSNLQLLTSIPTTREDLLYVLASPFDKEETLDEYGLETFSPPTCVSIPIGFEAACALTLAATSPVLPCNANWLAITTVFQVLSTTKTSTESFFT